MKFLTDTQAPKRFGEMLAALGHQVDTVYQHGLEKEKNDANLVAWARSFGFVFLTLDELRREQGVLVASELKRRGGKLISIHGGPQQGPERALGKLLFHWLEWYPKLNKQHGWVDIIDLKQKMTFRSRSEIAMEVSTAGEAQFDPYLNSVARRTRIGTKRPPRIRHDQPELDLTQRNQSRRGKKQA